MGCPIGKPHLRLNHANLIGQGSASRHEHQALPAREAIEQNPGRRAPRQASTNFDNKGHAQAVVPGGLKVASKAGLETC